MVKKTKRSSVAKMGKSIELERRHYYRKAVGLMTTGGKCYVSGKAGPDKNHALLVRIQPFLRCRLNRMPILSYP